MNLLKLCIIDQHTLPLSFTHTHTHTLFLFSMNLHARSHATSQMIGFKHQQYEIFMCQCQPLEQNYHQGGFAFRSEDTTAFIPLSLSLSLFSLPSPPPVSPSLSLFFCLPVVLQHPAPLSRRCVSVFSTIVLVFYDTAFILSSVVVSVMS